MKKLGLIVLALMVASVCFADMGKVSVENRMAERIAQLKSRTASDSARYVKIRQKLQDILTNQAANLDSADETAITAMVSEIQDIETALDDLNTKLDNNFPEIE